MNAPYASETNELLSFPVCWGIKGNVVWRDEGEWQDTLVLDSFGRGQSSAVFYFVSKETERSFPAFLVDSLEIFKYSIRGTIEGVFTVRKRGQNYGVSLVREIRNLT